jgi:hypothetical protein
MTHKCLHQASQSIPYTTTLTLVKQLSRFKIQLISQGKTHAAAIDGTKKTLTKEGMISAIFDS